MQIYFIRHGATKGNMEKRYVGRTDEELLSAAKEELMRYAEELREQTKEVTKVYVSPLKRCLRTADILFPEHTPVICEAFRECDFGLFEYKNYRELNGNPDYQRFIDTEGFSGFPGGEDRAAFQKRCVDAFQQIIKKSRGARAIALVVHGGTIMSILDEYSVPHKDYYSWQIRPGEGFSARLVLTKDGFSLSSVRKI